MRGCAFLGNVTSTTTAGPVLAGIASEETQSALRNKTASLRGNVLFVVSSGMHASGEAYYCGKEVQVVPGLEPGTELYGADGNLAGIVGSVIGGDVIVRASNGVMVRITRDDSARMVGAKK